MVSYIAPYIKENNILQLPLFYFGKGKRPKRTCIEWKDGDGKNYTLICDSSYGVPGGFDQDVYTACMRIWVKQKMPTDRIETNYSEIARELGISPRDWNRKIKHALLRLGKARYELYSCFVVVEPEGKREARTAIFSLFDAADLYEYQKGRSKKKSKFTLFFPKRIRENLERKYYQFLEMGWYRALPYGLPRRLYEYLAKKRYQNVNGVFIISEELLCRWLPIKDSNSTQRRKTLEGIAQALIDLGYLLKYEFNKAKKQCIFTYRDPMPEPPRDLEDASGQEQLSLPLAPEFQMDRLQQEKDDLPLSPPHEYQKQEITSDMQLVYSEALKWIESVRYLHSKKKKQIAILPIPKIAQNYPHIREGYEKLTNAGNKPSPDWIYQSFMRGELPVQENSTSKKPQQNDLQSLLSLMKVSRRTKKLERIVSEHYNKNGSEYVKWNILYANDHAKKSYSTFLQKALTENWAEEWQEETEEKIAWTQKVDDEKKRKAEEQKRQEEEAKRAEAERPLFLERVKEIDPKIKQQLWEKADQNTLPNIASRETNVKIQYASLLLQYLIDKGEDFSYMLLTRLDFGFINEITG